MISFDDPRYDPKTVHVGGGGLRMDKPADPLVQIDLPRLIETRLLVQANSGGGKTWANRRLLEQTHGKVQHLVIDPEGEMHTLREKFDYVLAAPKGGDCPADIKSAAMLARRLLELGVSAIIDIYDLGAQRAKFVKLFLESLMNAPREMWQPVIVLIEEAHKFCPERGEGEAESTESVKDLMTRGRKRGFCGVLSTQRLSVLHKSAAAECNNRLIGRTALDGDQDRAAKALGFKGRDQIAKLADLEDGHFYAFGPALCRGVTEIKVGSIQTTHERAGQRRKGPTSPRERVRQYLAQLADLPHEAEAEAKTTEDLKRQLADARAELAREKKNPTAIMSDGKALAQLEERLQLVMKENAALRARIFADQKTYEAVDHSIQNAFQALNDGLVGSSKIVQPPLPLMLVADDRWLNKMRAPIVSREDINGHKQTVPSAPRRGQEKSGTAELSRLERALLTALAQHGSLTKGRILLHAGYASSGTTSTAFARFVKEGWVTGDRSELAITEAGNEALGSWDPLPTGRALFDSLMTGERFSKVEKSILGAVHAAYPGTLGKGDALERAGYASSGTTSTAFAKLVAMGYLRQVGRGTLRVAEELT